MSFEVTVGPGDAGRRVEAVVRDRLRAATAVPVSAKDVRRLFAEGRVHVDGRPCQRTSARVEAGTHITVNVERSTLARSADEREGRVELGDERILLIDGSVVAVDKPPGLPSDATLDPRRDHAVAAVGRLLARRGEADALFAAHRIDADTSGVLLLARTREAAAALGRAFEARAVEKVYAAIVHDRGATLPETWCVENHLENVDGRTRSTRSGGAPARTDFAVVARAFGVARIEARPLTGRTHQIRAHLAEAGTPIMGDRIYSSPGLARVAPRLMLHSHRLTFPHPDGTTQTTCKAAPPEDLSTIFGAAEAPPERDDR